MKGECAIGVLRFSFYLLRDEYNVKDMQRLESSARTRDYVIYFVDWYICRSLYHYKP